VPTTRPGPAGNLPTVSKVGAVQLVTCLHCTHLRRLSAEFWVGEGCSTCVGEGCSTWVGEGCSCVEAWSSCFGVAPAPRNMGLPWPNTTAPFPLQPDWTTLPPLTRLHRYMLVCIKGFMVGVEAWAGCMSSLGCHTPDRMNLAPMLLTWRSTLDIQNPLHTIATYAY
jgi:hypothetical protein